MMARLYQQGVSSLVQMERHARDSVTVQHRSRDPARQLQCPPAEVSYAEHLKSLMSKAGRKYAIALRIPALNGS